MPGGNNHGDLLRRIPQVERLLSSDEFRGLINTHSRSLVTREIRHDLERLRYLKDGLGPHAKGSLDYSALATFIMTNRDQDGSAMRRKQAQIKRDVEKQFSPVKISFAKQWKSGDVDLGPWTASAAVIEML